MSKKNPRNDSGEDGGEADDRGATGSRSFGFIGNSSRMEGTFIKAKPFIFVFLAQFSAVANLQGGNFSKGSPFKDAINHA